MRTRPPPARASRDRAGPARSPPPAARSPRCTAVFRSRKRPIVPNTRSLRSRRPDPSAFEAATNGVREVSAGIPNHSRTNDHDPADDQPPHRRHAKPRPDRVRAEEQPHLGPAERGQPAEHERPAVAAAEMAVDRGQAQRHDHRVRLGAQHVVPVGADAEVAGRRERRRGVRGVAVLGVRSRSAGTRSARRTPRRRARPRAR